MLDSCQTLFDEGTSALNVVIHVTTTGNDLTGNGSIQFPYLTVQKGLDVAYNSYVLPNEPQNNQSNYIRPAVYIGEGIYNENIIIPPQVQIWGVGKSFTKIVGNATIDSKWSNYSLGTLQQSDFKTSLINIQIDGLFTIDFDTVNSNQGRITLIGCLITGIAELTQNVNAVVMNSFNSIDSQFGSDLILNGIPARLKNCEMISMFGALVGTIRLNQFVGFSADNYFESCGGLLKNIEVNAINSDTRPYFLIFGHQLISNAQLTINGKYSEIKSYVYSIPENPDIVLLNGASINQIYKVLPFPEPQADWNETDPNSPNYILNKPSIVPTVSSLVKSEILWLSNIQVIKNIAGGGYTNIYSHNYLPDPDVIDGKRRRIKYICNYSKTGGASTIQFRVVIAGLTLVFSTIAMGGAAITNDEFLIEVFINFRATNGMFAGASLKRYHPNNDFNEFVQNTVVSTWNKSLTNSVDLQWQTISGTPTHTFTLIQLSSELY